MVQSASSHHLTPTVLTFYPHPVEVLNPSKKLARLTTASEKLSLLESLGIERVLMEGFDAQLASLSPEDFFTRYLKDGLRAKSIHVGFNFRFGKNRMGDTKVLDRLCHQNDIRLEIKEPFEINGVKVSSSTIRELILRGDTHQAAQLLGRPYSMSGQVSHGAERGKPLGFPTANLHYPTEKVLPKNGVYATRVIWQKQSFPSITNIGVRPTFGSETQVTVEVHLIDFNARLYDEFLQLEFFERIRDEVKFDSPEALRKQIEKDISVVRKSKIFGVEP
jgi:riboflavin kinase/FMN adenylyltransferase